MWRSGFKGSVFWMESLIMWTPTLIETSILDSRVPWDRGSLPGSR